MIAFRVPESFDVLVIPSGWDVFQYQGWIYKRTSFHVGRGTYPTFYRYGRIQPVDKREG